MTVGVSHHDDAAEPDDDGLYTYHYEYEIYEFSDGVMTLIARAYLDEPGSAALIGWSKGKHRYPLRKRDLSHPLVLKAATYLRKIGNPKLDWLDRRSKGYVPLDDFEV